MFSNNKWKNKLINKFKYLSDLMIFDSAKNINYKVSNSIIYFSLLNKYIWNMNISCCS